MKVTKMRRELHASCAPNVLKLMVYGATYVCASMVFFLKNALKLLCLFKHKFSYLDA